MSSFMLCPPLCHNLCPFPLYRFVVSLCHFLCLHLSHLYAQCCTIIYAHYVNYKTKTSSFKIVLTQNTSNKEVDYMSYEKFITDFFNIKPSDLDKISTMSDGSVFIRVRLTQKSTLCPYCKNTVKVNSYYDRKLTHSTFYNRICYIIYEQRRYLCKTCRTSFNEKNFSQTQEKGLLTKPK